MLGCDLHDQYNKYYDNTRKSVKWWKKVFFWLIEVSVTNAFLLKKLNSSNQPPLTLLKFREELVVNLVPDADGSQMSKRGRPSSGPPEERLNGRFHTIEHRDNQSRDCKVCSNRKAGQRRETRFFCGTCTDRPALHPNPCFNVYHTRRNLTN